MSECVVRMEMPEGCGSCTIANFGYCSINHKPVADSFMGYPENRPANCPIICQLPEGHGPLVSEKDVRWAIDDIVLEIAERIGHVPMTKNETMEYVNQLPTIVPAEAERSEA